MPLSIIGSVALDSVETSVGKRDDALGGSATYFSVSASHFTKVKLVAVVGDDFTEKQHAVFKKHGVDITGLEKQPGKTFRWAGKYEKDINRAITISTELNVFETFKPKIPEQYRGIPFLFLANIDPELQYDVLSQMNKPEIVACDTMNLWIEIKKPQLLKLLKKVDILLLNDGEAKQLSGEINIIKSAEAIKKMGPKTVVIKRGEYGVICFTQSGIFASPGYPLKTICDPTGAGDSFAGGFFGYIARCGKVSDKIVRQALIYGNVMGSYNCESFSQDKLSSLTPAQINKRFNEFKKLMMF